MASGMSKERAHLVFWCIVWGLSFLALPLPTFYLLRWSAGLERPTWRTMVAGEAGLVVSPLGLLVGLKLSGVI